MAGIAAAAAHRFPAAIPPSASGRTPTEEDAAAIGGAVGVLANGRAGKSERGPWKNRIEFPHTARQEGHVPRSVSGASSNILAVNLMKLTGEAG